jgi:hypothetical protein
VRECCFLTVYLMTLYQLHKQTGQLHQWLATGWKQEHNSWTCLFATTVSRPAGCVDSVTYYKMGNRGSLPGIKQPKREAGHSPPSSDEAKELSRPNTNLQYRGKCTLTYGAAETLRHRAIGWS